MLQQTENNQKEIIKRKLIFQMKLQINLKQKLRFFKYTARFTVYSFKKSKAHLGFFLGKFWLMMKIFLKNLISLIIKATRISCFSVKEIDKNELFRPFCSILLGLLQSLLGILEDSSRYLRAAS